MGGKQTCRDRISLDIIYIRFPNSNDFLVGWFSSFRARRLLISFRLSGGIIFSFQRCSFTIIASFTAAKFKGSFPQTPLWGNIIVLFGFLSDNKFNLCRLRKIHENNAL